MGRDIENKIKELNLKLRNVFEEYTEINLRFKLKNKRKQIFMNVEVEIVVCLIEF